VIDHPKRHTIVDVPASGRLCEGAPIGREAEVKANSNPPNPQILFSPPKKLKMPCLFGLAQF
jgi:hypothetical protein